MSAKPNKAARRWLLLCAAGMFRAPDGRFIVPASRVHERFDGEQCQHFFAYWVRP